jgi:hypothetical protein
MMMPKIRHFTTQFYVLSPEIPISLGAMAWGKQKKGSKNFAKPTFSDYNENASRIYSEDCCLG